MRNARLPFAISRSLLSDPPPEAQRSGEASGPNSLFTPWDLVLGLFFLSLYSVTLSPGLLPADAGEYQVVGAVLGVAHPPGFALYTMLSGLATRLLFFLAPAAAINFFSAVLAALTLALLSRAVRRLTGSRAAGMCAALALGFSTTFWAQATTANIRMPAAFAVALAIERIVAYRHGLLPRRHQVIRHNDSRPGRTGVFIGNGLGLVALALGAGVSHHGSLVFVAAVLGAYVLWLNPAILRRPWPLVWGLLPFAAWFYLPLRAGAFGAPPNLATLDGFLQHVLARGFSGDILYFANPRALPDRLLIFANILTFEFTWPVLLLTALGGVVALWRDRQSGVVLLAAFALHSFIAITYRAPQTVEYLLPSYVLMAVCVGFAFAELFRLASDLVARGAPLLKLSWSPDHLITSSLSLLIFALVLTPQFAAAFPSYLVLARDTSTLKRAQILLDAAPPNAVILASWHWATPLWYLQQVDDQRPDVEVRYVFPRTASLAQDWADEITSSLPSHPVLVTSYYGPEYEALPYRFVPLGLGWEVRAAPVTTPPPELVGAQSFGEWTFLGYRLGSQPADLEAAWQTRGAPRDISFFVHLRGADGQLYGQMDVSHSATRYVSGEVLLDRYHVDPFLDAPPGDYSLVAGAYLPDGTRLAEVDLTTISIKTPAASHLDTSSVPIGAVLLASHTLFPAGPLHPGEAVIVGLRFVARQPITQDYAVKVELAGEGWRAVSEGTPVGGAIPTLKWITGSRLTDRHTLTIPADAPPGPAQLRLVLYDSFTQQPLPILRRELAALGPTVWLRTVDVVAP